MVRRVTFKCASHEVNSEIAVNSKKVHVYGAVLNDLSKACNTSSKLLLNSNAACEAWTIFYSYFLTVIL